MLGTLLEKLGGLLPKNFIISSFFPVLIFAFLNGLMCYLTSDAWRRWLGEYSQLDAGKQALYGFPVLIGIAVLAYIFSTFSLYLRQLLEGNYLPELLSRRLTAKQQVRLKRLQEEIEEYGRKRFDLNNNLRNWQKGLRDARKLGDKGDIDCTYTDANSSAVKIERLRQLRKQHQWIEFAALEDTVADLARELTRCRVDRADDKSADALNRQLLDKDHTELIDLIDYSFGQINNRFIDLYNEREFNFSRYKLAPTAMGNIAESINSYALTRYAINLEAFWSRLQKVIQGDEKFYATLLDAKTQLDFLVALFWVTAAFTAIWVFALLYAGSSILAFLVVGLVGPTLCILFYKIALQNYLVFADTLRTSIDLYRLDMLKALHVTLPPNTTAERQTWEALNGLIGYGRIREVVYKHPE